LGSETTDDENVTCVFFYVCRLNNIPFFYTKVFQEEVFSTHSDFHSMYYNEQINLQHHHYVWFLLNWVRVKKSQTIL